MLLWPGILAAQQQESVDHPLARVVEFHGNAGAFVAAGRALHDLDEARGSFALDVIRKTPMQAQYSCVADGWQAAAGVSAGKLNLHIVGVKLEKLETVVTGRRTGKELVFHLRADFLRKHSLRRSD